MAFAHVLHVEVQDALHQLAQQRRVTRQIVSGLYLYTAIDRKQQRRLYAGLESLKLGRGGDRSLADFLYLDPHTVARGIDNSSQDRPVNEGR